MCGDIFKCQGLNLSPLCSEMLLMVTVPGTDMQLGLKDRSSMARTSEASLSAESSPRTITCWIHRKPLRILCSKSPFYYFSTQSICLSVFWLLCTFVCAFVRLYISVNVECAIRICNNNYNNNNKVFFYSSSYNQCYKVFCTKQTMKTNIQE